MTRAVTRYARSAGEAGGGRTWRQQWPFAVFSLWTVHDVQGDSHHQRGRQCRGPRKSGRLNRDAIRAVDAARATRVPVGVGREELSRAPLNGMDASHEACEGLESRGGYHPQFTSSFMSLAVSMKARIIVISSVRTSYCSQRRYDSATTARHASSGSENLRIISATDWLVRNSQTPSEAYSRAKSTRACLARRTQYRRAFSVARMAKMSLFARMSLERRGALTM